MNLCASVCPSRNQPHNHPSTNQAIIQSTNQAIMQSTNHPTNHQSNQPINTNQSTNHPFNQSTNHPINQSSNHAINHPRNQQTRHYPNTPRTPPPARGRSRALLGLFKARRPTMCRSHQTPPWKLMLFLAIATSAWGIFWDGFCVARSRWTGATCVAKEQTVARHE